MLWTSFCSFQLRVISVWSSGISVFIAASVWTYHHLQSIPADVKSLLCSADKIQCFDEGVIGVFTIKAAGALVSLGSVTTCEDWDREEWLLKLCADFKGSERVVIQSSLLLPKKPGVSRAQ